MTAAQSRIGQVPSRSARGLLLLWALLPLAFGLPAGPCFGWAAWRLRSQALAIEAVVYLTLTVVWIAMVAHKGAGVVMGTVLAVGLAAIACGRAFTLRGRLLNPASSREDGAGSLPAVPAPDPGWSPRFPAESLREQGQSTAAEFACDGRDRHRLGVSPGRALGISLLGAPVIAAYVVLHLSPRALGAGIGLVLAGMINLLFGQWVEGSVLYFRRWGVVHELPLASVTAVRAAGRRSVSLSASGRLDPVKINLNNRYYTMPSAAREHLSGWLSAPHVQWTPEAKALLDGSRRQTATKRGRRTVLVWALTFATLLAGVGIVVWVNANRASLSIPDAPGYSTFTGPEGKPLPVGRPWGRPCQPIRFAFGRGVPTQVQAQAVAVVNQARAVGIDVTTENPNYTWAPQSLYYLSGQSPATSVQVGIFTSSQAPPVLSNGKPEHIALGWDARPDADGHNEYLSSAQGILQLRAIGGRPEVLRRSVRQLIAMTQGILTTNRQDSGIAGGSTIDQFTPTDVAAMKRMSGCI